jgi:hypothetical protein
MGAHIARPTDENIGEKQPTGANRNKTGDNGPNGRAGDGAAPDQEHGSDQAGHDAPNAAFTAARFRIVSA